MVRAAMTEALGISSPLAASAATRAGKGIAGSSHRLHGLFRGAVDYTQDAGSIRDKILPALDQQKGARPPPILHAPHFSKEPFRIQHYRFYLFDIVEYCPVTYPDQFNQEISKNKAVHIYFAQATPLVTYIDDSCLYLKEKKCRICSSVCKTGAIDFNQKAEKVEVKVGAIILAPGFKPYDAKLSDQFGYGRLVNVVTSLDYERLLCATGPYEGEIRRSSGRKDRP